MNWEITYDWVVNNLGPGIVIGIVTAGVLKILNIGWERRHLWNAASSARRVKKSGKELSRITRLKHDADYRDLYFKELFLLLCMSGFLGMLCTTVGALIVPAARSHEGVIAYSELSLAIMSILGFSMMFAATLGVTIFIGTAIRLHRDIRALQNFDSFRNRMFEGIFADDHKNITSPATSSNQPG